MTRRPLTLDDIAEIGAAVAERDRSEVFVLVSQIAAETIGWRMLTVLEYREAEGVVVRAHSSDPTGYPIGGTKRLADYTLNHAAMADGDCFLAATREEVRTTFADHEALFARGIGAILNVPIRRAGRRLGTLNLSGEERSYGPEEIRRARLLAVPLTGVIVSA